VTDHTPRDKVEEEKPKEFKKTPEYRRFKKLLKQVIKAPPLRTAKRPKDPSSPTADI
jgi:hypothetical protein